MSGPSIASLTVTFNAAQIICRQMEALTRQTCALDEIIVVDNGSTDDTLAVLSASYPQVKILELPENMGVGGAFSAGLEYAAVVKRHDWVWLLDDDSVPGEDTLAKMLEGLRALNGAEQRLGMLAPMSVNSEMRVSYPGLHWKDGWKLASFTDNKQRVLLVDAVISSGTLVRGDVVMDIGLPRADFFMDFVDFEYCLRLRKHAYEIGVVRDSCLEHSIGTPRRTRFLGIPWVWADHAPYREYYMWRNCVYTIWKYSPNLKSKLFVWRCMLRHALGVVLFGKKKHACLQMMFRGVVDGTAGRLGIRFRNEPSHA
jgi:rhamnosyltransferase